MAIERVRELKTGSNLGRYNNFLNMVKRNLKIMDQCVLHNWDGDQAERPTLDISDANFIKKLRKLCTLCDLYGIIVDSLEQGNMREHYLDCLLKTTDFNGLLKSAGNFTRKKPYQDVKYSKSIFPLVIFEYLKHTDSESTIKCIIDCLKNLEVTKHNQLKNLYTFTTGNTASMVKSRKDMTNIYKIIGIGCMSHQELSIH